MPEVQTYADDFCPPGRSIPWRAKGVPTIFLVIDGPVARPDIPGLCERVRVSLEGGDPGVVVCDVSALVPPDLVTVDALARMQLTVTRLGGRIQLLNACRELKELLALVGLNEIAPLYAELPLQARGQAEQREELRGIEEESDPGDLPA